MAVVVLPVDAVAGEPQYSAREWRQASSARYAGATSARPLGARSGVRPGTAAATASITGVTWTIKPHAGVLDLQTSAQAGVYEYAIDADVTGTITAASGIIRKDILYIQLSDPAEDGTPLPKGEVLYLAGTVANTAPTTPVRSMRLATITVPASGGGSATIAFDAPFTAAAGGVIATRTDADRTAIVGLGSAQSAAFAETAGVVYSSTGSAWKLVGGDDTGWIAATLQNGWVAFGAPHQTPRFRRLNGVVYIQGQIKGGTIASGTVIFNLPVGFRPAAYIVPAVWGNGGGSAFEINPNGNVEVGDIPAFALRQSITMAPFPADQ